MVYLRNLKKSDFFLLKILIKPAVARPASPFVPVSDRSYLVGV